MEANFSRWSTSLDMMAILGKATRSCEATKTCTHNEDFHIPSCCVSEIFRLFHKILYTKQSKWKSCEFHGKMEIDDPRDDAHHPPRTNKHWMPDRTSSNEKPSDLF